MTTPEIIAELRRLHKDACITPLRIDFDNRADGADQILDSHGNTVCFMSNDPSDSEWQERNGELIKAACNHMPRILDELERLRGLLKECAVRIGIHSDAHAYKLTREIADALGGE